MARVSRRGSEGLINAITSLSALKYTYIHISGKAYILAGLRPPRTAFYRCSFTDALSTANSLKWTVLGLEN